jgi:hypothetical protein
MRFAIQGEKEEAFTDRIDLSNKLAPGRSVLKNVARVGSDILSKIPGPLGILG